MSLHTEADEEFHHDRLMNPPDDDRPTLLELVDPFDEPRRHVCISCNEDMTWTATGMCTRCRGGAK